MSAKKAGRPATGQSATRPNTGQKVERPKGGRPRRDPAEVSSMFSLRLTAGERAAIEAAAQRDGIALSDWARRALLAAAQGI